jgi:hypothetical protein
MKKLEHLLDMNFSQIKFIIYGAFQNDRVDILDYIKYKYNKNNLYLRNRPAVYKKQIIKIPNITKRTLCSFPEKYKTHLSIKYSCEHGDQESVKILLDAGYIDDSTFDKCLCGHRWSLK